MVRIDRFHPNIFMQHPPSLPDNKIECDERLGNNCEKSITDRESRLIYFKHGLSLDLHQQNPVFTGWNC